MSFIERSLNGSVDKFVRILVTPVVGSHKKEKIISVVVSCVIAE